MPFDQFREFGIDRFVHACKQRVLKYAAIQTEQSIRLYEKAGQPAELLIVNGTAHFPLSEKDAPRTRVLIRSWLDRFFPTPLRGQG